MIKLINKIKYGDITIQYELIKSNRRKTSQITVTPSGIIVRIPKNKSDLDTKSMIQKKLPWIFEKQKYYSQQIFQSPQTIFENNSVVPYLGKNYKIVISYRDTQKVTKFKNIITFHIHNKNHTSSYIKSMYQNWLKSNAELYFNRIIQKYTSIMNVKPTKITLKNMINRWGSATQKNEINLNINLMKAPINVIEYVILHEMCHLKIKQHSHYFWSMLSSYMPEYKINVKWLEMNGISIT